jgi:hypothetical protein
MTKNRVSIDSQAMYDTLAASVQMQAALAVKAKEIAQAASDIARVEVYDTGFYADSFVYGAITSRELRSNFRGANAATAARQRGYRRRRSKAFSVAIEGEYKGMVGVVASKARTAIMQEYGVYGRTGHFVLTRAALESGGALGEGDLKPGTIRSSWVPAPKISRAQRRDEQAFRRYMSARGTEVSNRSLRNARKSGKALRPETFAKRKRAG